MNLGFRLNLANSTEKSKNVTGLLGIKEGEEKGCSILVALVVLINGEVISDSEKKSLGKNTASSLFTDIWVGTWSPDYQTRETCKDNPNLYRISSLN